ncbi:MAG: hypothetical protein PHR35_20335 [Kiritimatiellae bacterium]|nr:hypothetical protein [Kiritimatiellia bacterium]
MGIILKRGRDGSFRRHWYGKYEFGETTCVVNLNVRVKRPASVVDWHCLRTSFVTLALSPGVPVETLQLVTGHRTVAVVLANYYRPQRAHLRAALNNALPDVLTGARREDGEQKAVAEMRDLLDKVVAGAVTAEDRKRLR